MKIVKRLAVIAALLAPGFGHAADISHGEVWAEELTFAALRTVDALQSAHALRDDPRSFESSNVFDGGWLIGNQPSARAQYLYGGGEILLHAAVTATLVHFQVNKWVIRGWEAVTIGVDAANVCKNVRMGLRIHL